MKPWEKIAVAVGLVAWLVFMGCLYLGGKT